MIDSETARDRLTGDGKTPKVAITDEADHSVEKEKVGTICITSCLLRRYARLWVFLLIGVDGLSKKITPICAMQVASLSETGSAHLSIHSYGNLHVDIASFITQCPDSVGCHGALPVAVMWHTIRPLTGSAGISSPRINAPPRWSRGHHPSPTPRHYRGPSSSLALELTDPVSAPVCASWLSAYHMRPWVSALETTFDSHCPDLCMFPAGLAEAAAIALSLGDS